MADTCRIIIYTCVARWRTWWRRVGGKGEEWGKKRENLVCWMTRLIFLVEDAVFRVAVLIIVSYSCLIIQSTRYPYISSSFALDEVMCDFFLDGLIVCWINTLFIPTECPWLGEQCTSIDTALIGKRQPSRSQSRRRNKEETCQTNTED